MGFKMVKKTSSKINHHLLEEVDQALKELDGWGSVEIFVQNGKVTQITKRAIKKTNHELESTS